MSKLTTDLINKNLKFKGEKVTMPTHVWAKIAKELSKVLPEDIPHEHIFDIHGDSFCQYCGEFSPEPITSVLK